METMGKSLFTSESVTRGHPDKLCDGIADRILDECLNQDSESRVACEVTASRDLVHIFGEITTSAQVNYEAVARRVIAEAGYNRLGRGFDAESCRVMVHLHAQSPDIAMGISRRGTGEDRLDSGAGDQGMMFGFACNQTETRMPWPIELAHSLTRRLEMVRRSGELPYLLPDGKSQVTVEYNNGRPIRVDSVVISTQHEEGIEIGNLRSDVISHVILPTFAPGMIDENTQFFINPTGRFVEGGPSADSGLTGRKLMVDTYGGYACHGGGSFSGKDATKVDRTGAYLARYLAKNVVASGIASECEVQLSYAIGLSEPLSIRVDTFGTGAVRDHQIASRISEMVDCRPAAIIERFRLKEIRYSPFSCYGHFGSNASNAPWEQTDLSKLIY